MSLQHVIMHLKIKQFLWWILIIIFQLCLQCSDTWLGMWGLNRPHTSSPKEESPYFCITIPEFVGKESRHSAPNNPGFRPCPSNAIGEKSSTLSLAPCHSAPGWFPWMIPGPAPCLGVLEGCQWTLLPAPGSAHHINPAGTGTTEEGWDCVRPRSAPQPQKWRSIQILQYFLERIASIVLKHSQ